MKSLKWGATVLAVAVLGGALSTACSPTFVVMQPPGQDTIVDTVVVNGVPTRTLRIFRVDTVARVDTVVRTRTVTRTDTVVRVDTILRLDTIFRTRTAMRVDTVLRVDTIRVPGPPPTTGGPARVDTVRILRVDTVTVPVTERVTTTDTILRVDTVRIATVDTIRIATVDTVRLVRVDTLIRPDTVLVPGRRMLFVPPGHYPPDGQCRVWIHDVPPGQQARAAPCDALGDIPAGAFILFGGEAWDFEYDWVWEAERNPGTVPPAIIAVTRPGQS